MDVIKYDGGKTIGELKGQIDACDGKPIAELRVLELAKQGSGIYIFLEGSRPNREIIYVGKATSQSLAQRIAIHFDTREDPKVAFIAGIVRKIRKTMQTAREQPPLIDVIAQMEKAGTGLILITFSNHDDCKRIAPTLEKFLIYELRGTNPEHPKYNWSGGIAAKPKEPLKNQIP